MAQISKVLFGELAVKKGLVTREQVDEAIEIQQKLKEMGIEKTLGAVMHEKKFLSKIEVKQILAEMAGKTKDFQAIEGYQILGKLGAGGMGSVYKAFDETLKREVAIKILSDESVEGGEFLARFRNEAKAAAKLNHPNIVQALDVGESLGHHYLVMEYVDGATLKDWINRYTRLSEARALHVIVQVADALEHAWEAKMVHRDIKPGNVMINGEGVVKLCDMGLAKTVMDEESASITQSGIIMGTPSYLSPEQARSEDLDIRSDIYSLGVTMFHAVTGKVPFQGNSAATILYKHIYLAPPDPRELNPNISEELGELVLRMMSKEPEDRFQSPQELKKAADKLYDKVKDDVGDWLLEESATEKKEGSRLSTSLAQSRSGGATMEDTIAEPTPGGGATISVDEEPAAPSDETIATEDATIAVADEVGAGDETIAATEPDFGDETIAAQDPGHGAAGEAGDETISTDATSVAEPPEAEEEEFLTLGDVEEQFKKQKIKKKPAGFNYAAMAFAATTVGAAACLFLVFSGLGALPENLFSQPIENPTRTVLNPETPPMPATAELLDEVAEAEKNGRYGLAVRRLQQKIEEEEQTISPRDLVLLMQERDRLAAKAVQEFKKIGDRIDELKKKGELKEELTGLQQRLERLGLKECLRVLEGTEQNLRHIGEELLKLQ